MSTTVAVRTSARRSAPDVQPDGTWTHVITASAADVAEARVDGETSLEWSAALGRS